MGSLIPLLALVLCFNINQEVNLQGRLIYENNEAIADVEILLYKLPSENPNEHELTFQIAQKKDTPYKTIKTDKSGKFSFRVESDAWYCYIPLTKYYAAEYRKSDEMMLGITRETGGYVARRMFVEKGKDMDLGELKIQRAAYKIKYNFTFDGKPVDDVYSISVSRFFDPEPKTRVNLTKGYIEESFFKGDSKALFENKDGDLTAYVVFKPGNIPFETVTQEIKLVKGLAKLSATALDQNGKAIKTKAQLYLLPVVFNYTQGGFDENIKFGYPKHRFIFQPTAEGAWQVDKLPPGEYMAIVMTEGFKKIFPKQGPNTIFKFEPNKTTEIVFTTSKKEESGSIEGTFNPTYGGLKFTEMMRAIDKLSGIPQKKRLGIFLAKLAKDGNYYLVPCYPDTVFFGTSKDQKFTIDGIQPGEYLVLAGGVREWVGPKGDLIGEFQIDGHEGPFFPVEKVNIQAGKTVTVNIVTEISTEFSAKSVGRPINVEKGLISSTFSKVKEILK